MATGEIIDLDLLGIPEAGRELSTGLSDEDKRTLSPALLKRYGVNSLAGQSDGGLGPILAFVKAHPIISVSILTILVGLMFGLYSYARNAMDDLDDDLDDEEVENEEEVD